MALKFLKGMSPRWRPHPNLVPAHAVAARATLITWESGRQVNKAFGYSRCIKWQGHEAGSGEQRGSEEIRRDQERDSILTTAAAIM